MSTLQDAKMPNLKDKIFGKTEEKPEKKVKKSKKK